MIVFRPHMRRRGSVHRTYMAALPEKFIRRETAYSGNHRQTIITTVLHLEPEVRAWLDENMAGEWWTDIDRVNCTVRPVGLVFVRGDLNVAAFQIRWG
jgi:hypothetical protein